METPGYIALSRQMALRHEIDVIANNLANVNTSGFKGERMMFQEYLQRNEDGTRFSFVQDLALVRNLTEGEMSATDNPLDLALSGDGYFSVETPTGPQYTRAGNFGLDAQGQIVTASGHPLLGNAGQPIRVPVDAGRIEITGEGTVSTEDGPVGQIAVVTFENQYDLRKTAGGLFDAGEMAPQPAFETKVQQGMLEGSNVSGVIEVTRLIDTARSYTSVSRMMQDEHERQRRAIQALGAVTQA